MTLKEITRGVERVYQDEEVFPQNRWAKILGCPASTVRAAAFRGGVIAETRPPRFPNQPEQKVFSVSEFPKIIDGFSQTFSSYKAIPFHSWSQNIDVSVDFTVEPPSGTTLIYEYPKPENIIKE